MLGNFGVTFNNVDPKTATGRSRCDNGTVTERLRDKNITFTENFAFDFFKNLK